MARAFDAQMDDIETVEDLSAVVQALYATKGKDLEQGFLVFAMGGQMHVIIEMNKRLSKVIDLILDDCRARELDARNVIGRYLVAGWEVDESARE